MSGGFEEKFCKLIDGWDEVGCGTLQFYVDEWSDYSKGLIKCKGGNPDEYNVFVMDTNSAVVQFIGDEVEEIEIKAEINAII